MTYTYHLHEVIDLIDQASQHEILALCELIKEEKSYYSPFHLSVIAAAINIHLDSLQMRATG
jgi:hypothetical protein